MPFRRQVWGRVNHSQKANLGVTWVFEINCRRVVILCAAVGFVSGAVAEHAAAFPYRGSGRFFTGFVLYARTSSRDVVSGYVGGHWLPEFKNMLGSDTAESVDQQLNALALAHQSISLHNDAMLSFTRPLVMGVLNVTQIVFPMVEVC